MVHVDSSLKYSFLAGLKTDKQRQLPYNHFLNLGSFLFVSFKTYTTYMHNEDVSIHGTENMYIKCRVNFFTLLCWRWIHLQQTSTYVKLEWKLVSPKASNNTKHVQVMVTTYSCSWSSPIARRLVSRFLFNTLYMFRAFNAHHQE
jgi:hypothetical protein